MILISELITQALNALREAGTSESRLKQYRQTGFAGFARYCKDNNIEHFEESLCIRFLEETHTAYVNGEFQKSKWVLLRRSCTMLQSLVSNGSVDIPKQPKWEFLNSRLRCVPSTAEIEDNNNLFGLVYRAKQELMRFNLSQGTMAQYSYKGFDKIVLYCINLGITNYDAKTISMFVDSIRNQYASRSLNRMVAQNVRKAADMLEELHNTGCITWRTMSPWGQRIPHGTFGKSLIAFRDCQLKQGKLSALTIKKICCFAGIFLCRLEDSGFTAYETVTLKDISQEFVAHAKHYNKGGLDSLIYSLRTFFKVLYEHEDCDVRISQDFSLAIPRMAAPHNYVKEGFSADQTIAILEAVPAETAIGKRDYAMMMLSVVTGLRACDITALKRNDIDWYKNEVRLFQSKTAQLIALPLTPEVGNAIADYILNARPESDLPYIFLTANAPYRRFYGNSIGNRLRKYALESGVFFAEENTGFHNFRRGFGNRLLYAKIPLDLIAELLGHKKMDSSRPYLAADIVGLKSCGIPLSAIQTVGCGL